MSTTAVVPASRATTSPAPVWDDPRFRQGPHGLEPVPPDEDCNCGARRWRVGASGRWQCVWCWRTALAIPPTPDELATATTAKRAYDDTVARVRAVTEGSARRVAFERYRDRRPLGPIHAAWRAYLCHRANAGRYPVTPAMREWADYRLIDLGAEAPRADRPR
jgi:hypothetical protein